MTEKAGASGRILGIVSVASLVRRYFHVQRTLFNPDGLQGVRWSRGSVTASLVANDWPTDHRDARDALANRPVIVGVPERVVSSVVPAPSFVAP
jgi:hypothetical protein